MATTTPTYDELQAQIKKLQAQAETVRATEIEGVLADVQAKIAKYGLTAEQLGFVTAAKKTTKKASPSKVAAEVKYQKGDLTWSGASRGRKPQWVKDALEAGEDIEKYKIK